MAFSFGDGFDLYAAMADAYPSYWDSGVAGGSLIAGRFTGSQAIVNTAGILWTKSSGQNDAVHHLVLAFRQTAAISGSTLGTFLELLDGVTAQCTIVFRTDGAILLTSGGPAGTVLDTYTGAFPVTNTWYAFEIEVTINNTTGSWAVRKNGNTSNDHSLGSLDTQNSANAYANKLIFSMNTNVTQQQIDDLFWQSGASTGTWLGDIRCYTRMPTTDASVQFAQGPNPVTQTIYVLSSSQGGVTTNWYIAFVPSFTGTISAAMISLFGGTANSLKMAIFDNSNGGNPGIALGSATTLVAPPIGVATMVFPTPVSVTKGQTYYFGIAVSASVSYNVSTSTSLANFSSVSNYASFPVNNPSSLTGGITSPVSAFVITISPALNAAFVGEFQEDAGNSYVTDNTIGHNDLYNISTIASAPNSTVAVTTRAYVQKTDAGSRTASVQLKSGSTTVQSSNPSLSANTWTWLYRTDTVDPNTTLAWSAANVALAQIGPIIVT